jgi:hypothetical protein
MAVAAKNRSMRSGQRKLGIVMRERGRPPTCRRVAVLADCGKSGESMIGIYTRLKIRLMARVAILGGVLENLILVTGDA